MNVNLARDRPSTGAGLLRSANTRAMCLEPSVRDFFRNPLLNRRFIPRQLNCRESLRSGGHLAEADRVHFFKLSLARREFPCANGSVLDARTVLR